MNLKLIYLYRDAGNYKYWNEIVFTNKTDLSENEAHRALLSELLKEGLFIAAQIRLAELFPYGDSPTADDNCLHEVHSVENTEDLPTDYLRRDFVELVAEARLANVRGWWGRIMVPDVGKLHFIFDPDV